VVDLGSGSPGIVSGTLVARWQNLYHNAVAILHEVSETELRARLQDRPDFASHVRQVLRDFESYMSDKKTWGAQHAPALIKNPVAYFSAEFGFHETLPIAAGGWAFWPAII